MTTTTIATETATAIATTTTKVLGVHPQWVYTGAYIFGFAAILAVVLALLSKVLRTKTAIFSFSVGFALFAYNIILFVLNPSPLSTDGVVSGDIAIFVIGAFAHAGSVLYSLLSHRTGTDPRALICMWLACLGMDVAGFLCIGAKASFSGFGKRMIPGLVLGILCLLWGLINVVQAIMVIMGRRKAEVVSGGEEGGGNGSHLRQD